jgi:hypothetical protein
MSPGGFTLSLVCNRNADVECAVILLKSGLKAITPVALGSATDKGCAAWLRHE